MLGSCVVGDEADGDGRVEDGCTCDVGESGNDGDEEWGSVLAVYEIAVVSMLVAFKGNRSVQFSPVIPTEQMQLYSSPTPSMQVPPLRQSPS